MRDEKEKRKKQARSNKQTCTSTNMCIIHVLMRDGKEERSKQGKTKNKAKQHSTPKAVTFPRYVRE